MTTDKPSFAVLDFGSQTAQLICRRLRELKVYAAMFPASVSASELKKLGLKGIVLSGGPASVYGEGSPQIDAGIFELGVPILGICYGLQITVKTLGGKVEAANEKEYGSATMNVNSSSPLLNNISTTSTVWMSHGDRLEELPEGFVKVGSTDSCPYTVCQNLEKNIYGVQFHPEVTHTQGGRQVLSNFVKDICQAKEDWTMGSFIDTASESIRQQVGKNKVICGLSGGVDSSVLAALLHKAIGEQLTCIFVDHGLMRLNEREQVEENFGKSFGMNLISVDASEIFLKELKGVTDPEKKRKIIGRLFIECFQKEAKEIKDVTFLAQGTIYSDVIESAGSKGKLASAIKSHHNVGGLPEKLGFELVEPLRGLFKDEVRVLGRELGLPPELVDRHPFPGPGLAVRLPGAITAEDAHILRQADFIFIEELRNSGWYSKTFQAFAVLLPVRSTGVMGDARTYEKVCALRCVTSEDVMTADWAPIPHEILARMSTRIINEVEGINRVVYDISSKPPSTIEWE
jgi:GMP synthase (glutamine-hydrolysing)